MECPFCGVENLAGAETCDSCHQDLTSFNGDADERKGRLQTAVLGHLSDAPLNAPLVLSSKDSVADAIALMRQERHGSVQVVDDGTLVGIFTESDLLRRVEPTSDPSTVKLAEVMTPEPQTARGENFIAYALNGMAVHNYRHLPILDENEDLRGFVSVRGILAHIRDQVGL